MSSVTTGEGKRTKRRRSKIARIESLDILVGAHPAGLRDIFVDASPFDPQDALEATPRLLAVESLRSTYMLTRPLVVALSGAIMPWRNTHFESGGTAGQQRLLGGANLRFSAMMERSRLDDAPALVLRFAGLGNGRLVSHLEQELRRVGNTVAMGPLFRGSQRQPLAWLGIEVSPPSTR